MKYLYIIALCLAFSLANADQRKLTFSPKEDVGIAELKEGLLSKESQSKLYEQIKELFERSKSKKRSEILSLFGSSEGHIVSEGDDGIDRVTIHFQHMDAEVNRLSTDYGKITFLSGIMIAFENEKFIHWEPVYATRFTGDSYIKKEGNSEPVDADNPCSPPRNPKNQLDD